MASTSRRTSSDILSILWQLVRCGKSPYDVIVIDEILKGTNTKERVAASKAVLDYLSEKPAIVLTATHDLELVEQMDGRYDAYYFECSVEENDVKFSYKLHKGKNDITNAINIMKAMGFPEKVVKNAMKNAGWNIRT